MANLQRLRKLVALLNMVPAKKFNLIKWSSNNDVNNVTNHNSCGFVACACGWAASIPSFKKAGLSLTKLSDAVGIVSKYEMNGCIIFKDKNGEVFKSWPAVRKFFDLNIEDSEWLFCDENYPSNRIGQPKYVAKRIAAFIKMEERKAKHAAFQEKKKTSHN